MTTSATSSRASETVSLAAALDELRKIAAEKKPKSSAKKTVRNALLIGAGAGAGTGASMLAERYLLPHVVRGLKRLPPAARIGLLSASATLGGAATKAALNRMNRERDA